MSINVIEMSNQGQLFMEDPGSRVLYRQLAEYAMSNYSRVFREAEDLFGHKPSNEPRLIVAHPAEVKDIDLESIARRTPEGLRLPPAFFDESENLIYVNPIEIVNSVLAIRRIHDDELDPEEYILRVVANEDSKALYSDKHEKGLNNKAREYSSKFVNDVPLKAMISRPATEAISTIAEYKIAERLKQKDHMKYFDYATRRAQEVVLNYVRLPTPEGVGLFVANLGFIIAKEFIQIDDDEFRELVGMELEKLWDMMYERMKSKF